MKRVILVLVLCWPVVGVGQGGFYTGNQLMEWCDGTRPGEPKADVSKYSTCVGFLVGISDAADMWQGWGNLRPKQICTADGISTKQLRQVFLKYMRQRPESWHALAGAMAIIAFREAWPCKD